MKKSIIISLLLCVTINAAACFIPGTHNYYIFRTFPAEGFAGQANKVTIENWKDYTDGAMDDWFDADIVREAAKKKGDQLMLSYLDQLEAYLECANSMTDSWDYPTKEELNAREQQLKQIRSYAQSKLTSKLRSQHALLYMRCNMMLGQHAENIRFWEQTGSQFIETVYKDMMKNIYAGALFKSGRKAESARIFVEQGDTQSLYTQYYEERSLKGIRNEYQHDANSPVLPFLIEDFAKNAQEAYDATHGDNMEGKLFIRDIKLEESQQMCMFARQVVSEGKTDNPALWKSLEAWLLYLFGDRHQALRAANEAVALNGTPTINDNARVLQLYIRADVNATGTAYDNQLAADLQWLEEKANSERKAGDDYENFYTRVYDRLVHQVLMAKYDGAGRHEVATALMAVYDEQPIRFNMKAQGTTSRIEKEGDWVWNSDYSGDFFTRLDTITPRQLEGYLSYIQTGGKQSALDQWLTQRVRHDDQFLEEIIGTKHLRQTNWQEAIKHLEKVSVDFINDMNIAPYMAHRSYSYEPWVERQRGGSYDDEPCDRPVTSSQKLDFAREMMALEAQYKKKPQEETAYQLALRYYQASYAGDCWYLTHYGTSVYDQPLPGETDMVVLAYDLLQKTAKTSNFLLKEKALYAAAIVPTDLWKTSEWDEQASDFVSVKHPESQQYQALSRLATFARENRMRLSPYVSKCDVIRAFQ